MNLPLHISRDHAVILTKAGMDKLLDKRDAQESSELLIRMGIAGQFVLDPGQSTERMALAINMTGEAAHNVLFDDSFPFIHWQGGLMISPTRWWRA